MDYKWLLFGFHGRINRAKYWLTALIYFIVAIVMGVIGFVLGSGVLAQFISWLVELAVLVSSLAVGTKRLHDRGRSAWWLLVFYVLPSLLAGIGAGIAAATSGSLTSGNISATGMIALLIFGGAGIAIGVWAFVELGCLRGTVGYNQYGPDPLAAPPPATPSARRGPGR
jgi:uncharacterized membrane protein YhaH (DUF805 family)